MNPEESEDDRDLGGERKRKRGPYKKYLIDYTAKIPRKTLWNWSQTSSTSKENHQGNNVA